MKKMLRWTMAAAIAFAAQQASAQTSPLPGSNKAPGTPPAATPPPPATPPTTATPPATTPLPGAAPQANAKTGNDATTADTMQQVHKINVDLIQLGQLAQQKGSTKNVKDYGKRVTDEHERLDREITSMAQKRGISLTPASQIQADPAQAQHMQKLNALNGIQFDQAFMDLLVADREGQVPHLKQLRDRTPGRDAELKKWLSDMEVTMEHTRNESRNVRQAVRQEAQQQQRQGRKP